MQHSLFKDVCLNRANSSFLYILSLICLSLCKSHLISGCNKFKKMPYFSQVLLAAAGAILGRTNNKITNTLTCYVHTYKM